MSEKISLDSSVFENEEKQIVGPDPAGIDRYFGAGL